MKKLISISTISFLLFTMSSCYSTKTISRQEKFYTCMKVKNEKYEINKKIKVLSVISKKGDTIVFSKANPGIVSEQGVSGFQIFYFPYSAVDSTLFNEKSLQSIWVDGNRYEFVTQNLQGYVCNKLNTINIPLLEIEQMKVLKPNLPLTVAAIVVPPILAFVALYYYEINNLNLNVGL